MEYKTILVHVDESRHAPARMRLAAALAHAQHACLVGAAMLGVSRDVFPHGYETRPGTREASCFDPLAQGARRALAAFVDIAIESGVRHETRFICDQAADGLALQARFADLVVVSQDDPDEAPAGNVVRVPDHVILECARPVLVVPHHAPPGGPMQHVLLAWDGSREASFAMSAALPLLRQARGVTVAGLSRPGWDDGALLRLQDVVDFLGHHHVHATILERTPDGDVGRTLLGIADEFGHDLLVMGCYGHTRLRELCLGGASRTVLLDARIPVVMAH